ncbi:MAG: efflux RND transporter periplasmic adaptor subunit [Planctomycetaceae bacterium]
MRRALKWLIVLGLLAGGVAGWGPLREYWKRRSLPSWRFAEVLSGDIISVVNATGKVQPVRKITVGSFVSGPIDTSVPMVAFNSEVQKGQLLCKIDTRIYAANLQRDKATLDSREADLRRANAQLQQARRDLDRAVALRKEDKSFIAQAEMDKFYFSVLSLEAQEALAKASVEVARSQLEFSTAQVEYCEIRAPETGMVIDRKIEPGATLAAQFQTPELFVIAPNLRERVDLLASVDESEIGLIRDAGDRQLPVTFTVDAYTDALFTGRIEEVRMNASTTQNVVTYPVLVSSTNPDLKLLPGMTASISFEVDERKNVTKVPNAALRFFPNPRQVRLADRPLLEGAARGGSDQGGTDEEGRAVQSERSLSATERAELRRKRSIRHVWVPAEEGLLRAIEVETGLSDSQHTELTRGEVKAGDQLVIGLQIPGLAN